MKDLKAAIEAGDLDSVRQQIAAGVDVGAAFDDGTTPIQLAARRREITILRALVAAGAALEDLEVLSFEERLMLFFDASRDAIEDDDLLAGEDLSSWAEQAVAELMDSNVAAEIAAHEGELFRAVRTGDLELLKERIEAGEHINPVREVTRDTPLTLAVQGGDEEIIRTLIAAGANVNYQGYSTPLSFALPDLGIAKLLIDAGADAYARGLDHQSPLQRAVQHAVHPSCAADSLLVVRFFLEAGVDPQSSESFPGSLLFEVEAAKAWEVYHELLPHYPEDVARESFEEAESRRRRKTSGGWLQWSLDLNVAAGLGDLRALDELLENQPTEEDHEDVATFTGRAVREVLMRDEPDVELQEKVIRRLIAAGADLDTFRSFSRGRGSSPLACAAESWHPSGKQMLNLLLEAGADVDAAGELGRSALMYAVTLTYRHNAPLAMAVPALLSAGADPNHRDEFGLTAWALAKAPLIEEEERTRAGAAWPEEEIFIGPDLSELFDKKALAADARSSRLQRCRKALTLLEDAGGEAVAEIELRLCVAARVGDAARVAELLAEGANPDARGVEGQPAIVGAALAGSRESMDALIKAGCEVDATLPGDASALQVAVQRNDPEMARQLLEAGASAATLLLIGHSAMKAAEEAGGDEVVALIEEALPEELVGHRERVAASIQEDDLYWDSIEDLPRRAAAGDLAGVDELLQVPDVDIDGCDGLRRTALMAACEAGQLETVRGLIARGARVDFCNDVPGSPRSTALCCAAIGPSAERGEILRLLLEAGAAPDQRGADGRTALMHAVERDVGFFGRAGDFGVSVKSLLAAGADLEIRDPFGLTAWMRAMSLASSIDIEEVAVGYEQLAKLLEDAGASTQGLPDIELVWAVEMGDSQRVEELLEVGADPNARRHDGATALILAVRDGRPAIVQQLLAAGCDVDARQGVDRGPTAHDAAVESRDQRLVRLLVAAGATPEADEISDAANPDTF